MMIIIMIIIYSYHHYGYIYIYIYMFKLILYDVLVQHAGVELRDHDPVHGLGLKYKLV